MMNHSFASAEAFFQSARSVANELEAEGHAEAAATIRAGLSHVNGVTDGWALLGEALDDTKARHGSRLTAEQQAELDALASFAWNVVHRQ